MTRRDDDGDRTGLRRSALRDRSCSRAVLPRRVRGLPRLPRARASSEARRLLTRDGTFYFHIDYREAHYCKVLLDEIFGRDCFLNEIIWAYDYGGRAENRWPAKHDTILVYVRDPERYYFDHDAVDREPLHGAGPRRRPRRPRAASCRRTSGGTRSCRPTAREKTGYPTQKPEGILRRIVQASTRPGDWCLDFFAGSGTLGASPRELGRRYVLVDSNPEAVEVMRRRLSAPATRTASAGS